MGETRKYFSSPCESQDLQHLNALVLHGGNLSAREYLVTKTRRRIGAAPGRADAVRAADVELCVARLASLA